MCRTWLEQEDGDIVTHGWRRECRVRQRVARLGKTQVLSQRATEHSVYSHAGADLSASQGRGKRIW